ncbi:hypothetical protein ACFR99_01255 [Haloarchaeobius amylolyticus]|uniref:Uncharacterized protein n=1 Tax=Haloarchaeobius amylolyticus TaxID=1198296 RepID=A0ABD6BAV4_9EURY
MSAVAHEKIDRPATDLLGPIQVPANSDAGFNYPYYLYLPETTQREPVPMLVEPNNSGFPSDDLEEHRAVVQERLADGLGPQLYSKALAVPLLVPVFPRPAGEIASVRTYTHALDENTLKIEGTEIDRIDLQLLNMIEHAQELLEDLSYPVADDILMNGFSASGNFVNRFAALHPEKVRSLSAGGINGTPILPLERAKGHELDYPIGIKNLEELTGERFNAASWRDVAQYLYLGGEDENDTIPFDDAWSERHQRVAVDVYGEDMQEDRMPYSETIYEEAGANATFKVYDGVGHTNTPLQIQRDVANFHRRNGELKQVTFTEQPTSGDTSVQLNTFLFDDQDFQLRVWSADRGDLTETPASVATNKEDSVEVQLRSAIEQEEIIGAALPKDVTTLNDAVASVSAEVNQLPLVSVVDTPTSSRPTMTVEYGVESSYQSSSPIHLFVLDSSGGRALLTTFGPGTKESRTFDLTGEDSDVSVEEGTELTVSLVDVDDDRTISETSVVVGKAGDNTDTASGIESMTFATQPTNTRNSLDVTYRVSEEYEPTNGLTLQAKIGRNTTVLLGTLAAGEETTETFSLEQIPKAAGDDILIKAVDEQVLATDRTMILRDTVSAVTVEYTSPPTSDDPSATVKYSIDESYEVKNALTLRVYDGTLYGGDAVDAIKLLSPGDTGTATFTIGEDSGADVDDPVVAIVDDVPVARATTDGEFKTDNKEEGSDEESKADNKEETSEDGSPGFGIGTALASLGGLGYVLRNRLTDSNQQR